MTYSRIPVDLGSNQPFSFSKEKEKRLAKKKKAVGNPSAPI